MANWPRGAGVKVWLRFLTIQAEVTQQGAYQMWFLKIDSSGMGLGQLRHGCGLESVPLDECECLQSRTWNNRILESNSTCMNEECRNLLLKTVCNHPNGFREDSSGEAKFSRTFWWGAGYFCDVKASPGWLLISSKREKSSCMGEKAVSTSTEWSKLKAAGNREPPVWYPGKGAVSLVWYQVWKADSECNHEKTSDQLKTKDML